MSAICGHTSLDSLAKCGHPWCSWKTSRDFSQLPLLTAAPLSCTSRTIYLAWVSALRRDSLRRLKSARRTGGSACSFWPTAGGNFAARKSKGGCSNLREHVVLNQMWATPRAQERNQYNSRDSHVALSRQTALWASKLGRQAPRSGISGPTCLPDCPSSLRLFPSPRANKWGPPDSHGWVPEMWQKWPTPRANDAEKRGEIAKDQRNGLPAAVIWQMPHGGQPKGMRLNPRFASWLMNLQIGWVDFEPLAKR